MDAKSMKTLKEGDKIRYARGAVNAGMTAIFIRVIPSDGPGLLDRIEFLGSYGINSLPHDRFTKVK